MDSSVDDESKTTLKVYNYNVKFDFHWEISSFSNHFKDNVSHSLKSPYIEFDDAEILDEKIQVSLKSNDDSDFLSMYLDIEVYQKVKATVKFRLLNTAGDVFRRGNLSVIYSDDLNSWGWNKLIKKSQILNNKTIKLHHDTLVIDFSVIIHPLHSSSSEEYNPVVELANDFDTFFEKNELCDVTIAIKDRQLRAHKSILAARSSVFFALFSSDMIENKENKIEITDVSYDVMKEVLRFLYSGEVKNLNKFKKQLLAAADKYDIEGLKAICERDFQKNINIDNCCEVLKVVQLYNCPNLRSDVVQFIADNLGIAKSEDFIKITDKDPQILRDVMTLLDDDN